MAYIAAFLVLLLAAPCALAVDYPIEWNLSTNYSSWATRPLNVNDRLIFTYTANTHTVDVVTASNFGSCSSSSPISSDQSGRTTITLSEGTTYIICGIPGHCGSGMALQATARGSGSPSPSGSTTPTPPSGGNGATGLSSATPFVFGLPLVLGTLFAFLG